MRNKKHEKIEKMLTHCLYVRIHLIWNMALHTTDYYNNGNLYVEGFRWRWRSLS